MKIAIPTANGKLCMHFGHCETFTMLSVNPGNKTITASEELVPPPHEPGVLPHWLAGEGADMIIAGGMGQRAQSLFGDQDIKVMVGAPADLTPSEIVQAHLAGTLQTGTNTCDH